MVPSSPAEFLERLRQLPADDPPKTWWQAFDPRDWPALFALLGVAADLPRLSSSSVLDSLPEGLWPELGQVSADVLRLQKLVDLPIVPPGAQTARVHTLADLAAAQEELETSRCAAVDFLLSPEQQSVLDGRIENLAQEKTGSWGELQRSEEPELFELFDAALGSDRFRTLTGFVLERDAYTLTLSLQDLDATGIGWHRDLYWPREWVGEDVFPVLYGLGDDTPAKGGAFVHYVPEDNTIYTDYRKRHQATVMWNCRDSDRRLLHAVSGYNGTDTSRHLIILQCLRRGE